MLKKTTGTEMTVPFQLDIEPKMLSLSSLTLKVLVSDYVDLQPNTKETLCLNITEAVLKALRAPVARISPVNYHIDSKVIKAVIEGHLKTLEEFKENQFFKEGKFLIEFYLKRRIGETSMTTSCFVVGPEVMLVYASCSFNSFVDRIIEGKQ